MFLFRIVSVKKVKQRSDALSPQSAIATGIGVVAGETITNSESGSASVNLFEYSAGVTRS